MLANGTLLGHYRILNLLGSGGMADVYEAEDQRLGRRVALKVLPPEFGRNPQLVARFEKEVRSAASLNHAGIVTVFEVGHAEGVHYYSMRLLTGGDLRARINRGLSDVEALSLLREIADAFAHAHAAGFVHRDVKPENILFDEQGRAVLTDFGIAKAISAESKMTATGLSIGTPRYISPEQARGRPVDARADLYSLGAILYEMLSGSAPYDAEDSLAVIFKHVTEPIPQLPDAMARYQPLIDALMAKEPDQRPDSAAALIAMIDPLLPAQASARAAQQATVSAPPVTGISGDSLPTLITGTGTQTGTVNVAATRQQAPSTPVSTPAPPEAPAAAEAAPEPSAMPAPDARKSPRSRRAVWIGASLALALAAGLAIAWLGRPTAPESGPVTAASDAGTAAEPSSASNASPPAPADRPVTIVPMTPQMELEQFKRKAEQAEREAAAARKAAAAEAARRKAAEAAARRAAAAEAARKAAAQASKTEAAKVKAAGTPPQTQAGTPAEPAKTEEPESTGVFGGMFRQRQKEESTGN